MKVIRAILLFVATIYFVSFIFNAAEFGWSNEHGFHSTGYHGLSRLAPLLISLSCGLWYYGLGARNIWAWRFGIVVFVAATGWSVIDAAMRYFYGTEPFDRWYDLFGQTVGATLVCFLFLRWWCRKRRDFVNEHTA